MKYLLLLLLIGPVCAEEADYELRGIRSIAVIPVMTDRDFADQRASAHNVSLVLQAAGLRVVEAGSTTARPDAVVFASLTTSEQAGDLQGLLATCLEFKVSTYGSTDAGGRGLVNVFARVRVGTVGINAIRDTTFSPAYCDIAKEFADQWKQDNGARP